MLVTECRNWQAVPLAVLMLLLLPAWKLLIFRVPHYKTKRELAAKWETRQARKQ
jgi:hypothetical protein